MTTKTMLATALAALAVGVAGAPAMADVLVQTQTLTKLSELTNWTDSFTFDRYNPIAFGGAALTRVEIDFFGEATSTLSVTAQTTTQVFGTVGASILASFFAGGLVLNVIPESEFGGNAAPGITIPAGTTLDIGPLQGTDTDDRVFTALADLVDFSGTGSFDVDLDAMGALSIRALGGNVSNTQVTSAAATMEIRYYNRAEEIIAPDTLALFALGLLGFAALGHVVATPARPLPIRR